MEYSINLDKKYSSFLYSNYESQKLYNVSKYVTLDTLVDTYGKWKERMPKIEYKPKNNDGNSDGCSHAEYELPKDNKKKYIKF